MVNRRMRTRTYGGVRGGASDDSAYSIEQSVRLCQRAGMISLAHLAVDGSKLEANASKRKATSNGRMVEVEDRLQAEIDGYLKRAQEEDAAEDALFGPDQSGPKLPAELQRRERSVP